MEYILNKISKINNGFQSASQLVKQLTDIAYSLSPEWKEYMTTSVKSGGVKTTPLRTLADGSYECMVPLKRPMRLDGFKASILPIARLKNRN